MRQTVIFLSLSAMLLVSAAAVADDSVMIRIYNDGADDVVVTVYDMNTEPPMPVVANQRINGFAWIPVEVTAGAVGKGHVRWISRIADTSFHRCGHEEVHGVASDALVYVVANSSCRGIVR